MGCSECHYFETTFTWLPTFETATVANGALANSLIINWARSPNARFGIFFYFLIECKYETLTLFRGAIEEEGTTSRVAYVQ